MKVYEYTRCALTMFGLGLALFPKFVITVPNRLYCVFYFKSPGLGEMASWGWPWHPLWKSRGSAGTHRGNFHNMPFTQHVRFVLQPTSGCRAAGSVALAIWSSFVFPEYMWIVFKAWRLRKKVASTGQTLIDRKRWDKIEKNLSMPTHAQKKSFYPENTFSCKNLNSFKSLPDVFFHFRKGQNPYCNHDIFPGHDSAGWTRWGFSSAVVYMLLIFDFHIA